MSKLDYKATLARIQAAEKAVRSAEATHKRATEAKSARRVTPDPVNTATNRVNTVNPSVNTSVNTEQVPSEAQGLDAGKTEGCSEARPSETKAESRLTMEPKAPATRKADRHAPGYMAAYMKKRRADQKAKT